MSFEAAYEAWMNEHISKSSGERLRRLQGKNHAEKLFAKDIWYPLVGHFRDLHPEYEIKDGKDGIRFSDYAFLPLFLRSVIENDGYGPHQRDVSRWQFSDERQRQNDLALDGWIILRFTYDAIREKPRTCQQTIHRLLSLYARQSGNRFHNTAVTLSKNPNAHAIRMLPPLEKEIVLFAQHIKRPFQAIDICQEVKVSLQTVRRTMKKLCQKGLLIPVNGHQRERIHQYELGSFDSFNKGIHL